MVSRPSLPDRRRFPPDIPDSERQRIAERGRRLLASESQVSTTRSHSGAAWGRVWLPAPGCSSRTTCPCTWCIRMKGLCRITGCACLPARGTSWCMPALRTPRSTPAAGTAWVSGTPHAFAAPSGGPWGTTLTARCRNDRNLMARLAGAARDAGRLTVFLYVTGGHDRLLAGDIARLAGVPLAMAAPPPGYRGG